MVHFDTSSFLRNLCWGCWPHQPRKGLSGRLPESDSIEEFRQHLINKKDMVTEDDRRWPPGHHGLPRRIGKLKDLTKFDASHFGVHPKQAKVMDPQLRLLLEVTHEAIIDSGSNLRALRGSKTGVFIGCIASECHEVWSNDPEKITGYELTGCARSMFANRLSFFFDFKGPSYVIDTACSSSLLALNHALQSIRAGQCDSAVVGGCNLCLKPQTCLQFQNLNMLSPEGSCKSFDSKANGYCRSEAVVCVFLQREVSAKRIYATLVHSNTNCDGNKEQGVTFPSGDLQKQLLKSVYAEAGINPAHVSYVEAHGTGTPAGDPQELNSITEVFCTADRRGSLLIGSTKSNMGHPEPVAGLAALAKIIIAMEDGAIPANLHYKSPNPDIPGLANDRLSVVSDRTAWEGGYVGINSFGFGGSNVHAILKSNSTPAAPEHPAAEKTRLVTLCGRTQEAVESSLEKIASNAANVELHSLLQLNSNARHPYRGYKLLNNDGNVQEIQESAGEQRPVWYVFSGMGSQWLGMGRDLMNIETFKTSILHSNEVLSKYNSELYDMLMNGDESTFNSTLNSLVSIVAIQVALVDVLKELGIQPDGLVGHSVGELGCAYADGGLTAEEAILAAYWRGQCIEEADLPPGGMAAVGMTWDEAMRRCPEGVVAACHNSKDNVTISGPREAVNTFVEQLQSEGIFAKNINSSGVAFHSPCIASVTPALEAALLKVIKNPKPRSSKWISSSIPADRWSENFAKSCSAEYHVSNVISPVLFQEALQYIPDNAITVEIAPHCLLQAILKRSLSPNCTFVGLMKREHTNNLEFLLSSLGKLYLAGVDFDPLALFTPVKFPVSTGTPNIASFMQWDHTQSWDVPTPDMFYNAGPGNGTSCVFEVDTASNPDDQYLTGHMLDGRVLFPVAGYLQFAWRALAKLKGQGYEHMPVAFENVQIHRATILPKIGVVKFLVTSSPVTGQFEVFESDGLVLNGRISLLNSSAMDALAYDEETTCAEDNDLHLESNDIYKELRLRGYEYAGVFQGIISATNRGDEGYLAWTGNWVTFVDAMLQMQVLNNPGRSHRLPTRIESLSIDPRVHQAHVLNDKDGRTALKVVLDRDLDTMSCFAGGVKILGLHATEAPRRHQTYAAPTIEQQKFIPYSESLNATDELKTYAEACAASASRILNKMPGFEFVNLAHDFDDDEYDGETSGVLLQALQYIEALSNDDTNVKNIVNILEERKEELTNDKILRLSQSERMLKTLLDIVQENCHRGPENLKIVEYGTTGLFNRVIPFMSTHPQLKVDYTVTGPHIDQLYRKHLQSVEVKYVAWNLHQPLTNVLRNVDVVIFDGSLNSQADLCEALRIIKGLLRPDGFILIIEPTCHFSIPLVLSGLAADFTQMTDLRMRSDSPFCNDETWKRVFDDANLQVIAEKSDQVLHTLYLCRPAREVPLQKTLIDVDDIGFQWVEEVKVAMAETEVEEGQMIWLQSERCSLSGIVGMVNSLRKEDGGIRIRCLFNACGSSTLPGLESKEFVKISKKDLVMNVRMNNRWGSFRHMSLPTNSIKTTEYACISALTRGDLSSLKWVESFLKYFDAKSQPEKELCQVAYTGLNLRDLKLVTGKLPPNAIPGAQDCILGMEFSGYNTKGESVMGLLPSKGLATVVDAACKFLWPVPDSWTLEEAVTVPVVYATAYYALVVRGRIRRGERVLIHSESGGIGQAAIAIALDYGCEVFTTVDSQNMKQSLKQQFPSLQDRHFSSSSDCSFRKDIIKATGGKGVDVVLNSHSEEKFQSSMRILAQHGRFLEIGKFDLSKNTYLDMAALQRNITFHGISLDALFEDDNGECSTVYQLLKEGIKSRTVLPLKATTFEKEDVEGAFRFMAQGKDIGKVVVKIQGEQKQPVRIPSITRSLCQPEKTYVLIGGLGGVGLEVANWLVGRGARNLVLTSRCGIRSGYQSRSVTEWRNQGVNVTVCTSNVLERHGAEDVIKRAQSLGPVGGIFNMAMVLKDGLMKNQTVDNFVKVAEPKVIATIHLDQCSRQMCKESLDWFVVFSSDRSRNGAVGLANYAFANSALERICEQRQRDGFPGYLLVAVIFSFNQIFSKGIAIQWGAIGDVGVVVDSMGGNEAVVGGILFSQAEYLMIGKKSSAPEHVENGNILDAVTHILGIKDPASLNPDVMLVDLGLDSLMSTEVKQTLERDFDIVLPMREIRSLTFNKMDRITKKNITCDPGDGTNLSRSDKC
ncbi:hypothetical protein CAPTEDRAFT_216526 [Capitella teleta]|uniref:Fatty acid synthase n=1 Tax=Capitella teleta TaxID=283909 RepID=R7UUV6_CAPTE|nr:hypothetical protein CAPTEDRAFT_216526 [Capitella teleta]|eukprot:ELU07161.1 hypothetical protein CAPTEDRAFT_216526 [Capitella teleta]